MRRARRYARRTGQEFRLETGRGKGSHSRLRIGPRFTTLRRGELSKGMVAAMLRQLDIDGKEF